MKHFLKNHPYDLIAICTPNGLHAQHAIQASAAGFNVLVEKPLTIYVADAQKMIKAAQENNKALFVVKQNRYNPPVKAVKKILLEERLGKIVGFQINCFWNRTKNYYTSPWRGTNQLDGGTLYTQFSHFIDL